MLLLTCTPCVTPMAGTRGIIYQDRVTLPQYVLSQDCVSALMLCILRCGQGDKTSLEVPETEKLTKRKSCLEANPT